MATSIWIASGDATHFFAAEHHQLRFCHQRLCEGWAMAACTRTPCRDVTEGFLQPNVISKSSAISACEKGGQWPQALGLLFSKRHNHLLPDVISYTFVIIACEKGGKWQQALGLLQECDTMVFSGRRHQLQFCNHCL